MFLRQGVKHRKKYFQKSLTPLKALISLALFIVAVFTFQASLELFFSEPRNSDRQILIFTQSPDHT